MAALVLLGAYILGSIPTGLLVVRLVRGRDIRYWFSGRTGGTNVMRMAGFWAGLITTLLDLAKGTLAVYLARLASGGNAWVEAGAGLLAVIGHNHSIFLPEIKDGRFRLRGGAGGATIAGAATFMWPPALLILTPISMLILYGIGYASLATMSLGVVATLLFTWRALTGQGPWAYGVFGVLGEVLLILALRPNIQRLLNGEERLVGWRARKKSNHNPPQKADGSAHA